MSGAGRKPENPTKQLALVFLLAAAALFVVGSLAAVIAPVLITHAALKSEDIAQFIFVSNVNPKPLQRFIFLCVILLTVPVLALSAHVARRFFSRTVLLQHAGEPDIIEAASLNQSAQWLVTGLVMLFAIYTGGYFRLFGADEVDYKFIDPVSLDAVIYSIVRIGQGGTCLVDVTPLYGCYGEFFRPLWSLVAPSVTAIIAAFFVLYLISIFMAMRFASRLIREPTILLVCGIALVVLSCFFGFFDPDFQYWPLRTIFPCLALALAPLWLNEASSRKAFALGVFSAFAISWNLDSGFPVFLSFAILIAAAGCTSASSLRALLDRTWFVHLGIYCLGAVLTLLALLAYLSLRAGALTDPSLYIRFQRLFYFSGYLMVPTPPLPHPWGLVVAVILLALSALAIRVVRGQADVKSELMGFGAILAIGVFVYYTGRSHIRVLETVSWLPCILGFCVADRIIGDNTGTSARTALRLVYSGIAILFVGSWALFYGKGISDRWAGQLGMFSHAAPLVEDADFIASQTSSGDKIAVLAQNQGSLTLTAGRTLDMRGPGMIETYIWPDAAKTMDGLRDHGPDNLFIDPRIRGGDPYQSVFSIFEAGIRSAYVAKAWEFNGRLLHLVRRSAATDQDIVPYDRPLQVSGGNRDFPLLVAKTLSGKTFQLEMKVIARLEQGHLAIIASSTNINLEPFQGIALYHQVQMGQDQWALAMGDGAHWSVTSPFSIPSGRPATVKISYAMPEVDIFVDDKIVFKDLNFAVLAPSADPLYIGDWIAHMYRPDAPMDAVLDLKFGSKNYWKIQDRRFNGEVVSARLMP